MYNFSKKLWVKWKPGDIKKVAIDLPQGLGDQIMCFPLFDSLKKNDQNINITVITSNRISADLLAYNRNIDSIKTFDMEFSLRGTINFFLRSYFKFYSLFKTEKYDLFIQIHPNPLRDLLWFLLPAERKIYNRENLHKFNEVCKVLEYLKIPVSAEYSIDFDYQSDLLTENNLKSGDYIILDIYAQYLDDDPRQWFYFPDLISSLKQITKKKIVIAGMNKNHKAVTGVVDLINKTGFKDLLYLIKNASAVVSMDTFYFHMSYCFKTPVVALFGPVNPRDRSPFNGKLEYKTIYKSLECSPCIENKVRIKCGNGFKCMKDISVDDVISAVRDYL